MSRWVLALKRSQNTDETRWVRVVASAVSVVLLSILLLVIYVLWMYLTEHGRRRITTTIVIVVLGIGIASLVRAAIVQLCRRNSNAVVIGALFGLAALAIALSPFYYGRITYARFGFTVYGLIPIPTADITIGRYGALWFRDKSHALSLSEVERLLSPGVETLIVGTGWHDSLHVPLAVRQIKGIELLVRRTPDAFDLYNEYRSQGKRVVLIAHSTC